MRLFIAIEPPKRIKADIKNSIHCLNSQFPQISWTRIDNLHLTLKFLGNIIKANSHQDDLLTQIKNGIERSTKGIRPFVLEFENLGLFDRSQLIVWIGVNPNAELLFLVNRIEQEMQKLGWDKEKHPYSPHITIGRGKMISKAIALKIRKATKDTPQIKLAPYLVSEITLVQSTLTTLGSIYTPLGKFALRQESYIMKYT